MKNVTLIALAEFGIWLLLVPMAWGQGGNPPADSKASNKTSEHGKMPVNEAGTSGSDSVVQQIKTLQGELLQAILKSDTSVFEKYYADDYIAIHGDGKLTTKAQEIENFKSGITKYDSITVREAKIRTYGDTVIVNALATVQTTVNGKRFSGDVRNTRVWVKQGGTWKLVEFQATRVLPANQ